MRYVNRRLAEIQAEGEAAEREAAERLARRCPHIGSFVATISPTVDLLKIEQLTALPDALCQCAKRSGVYFLWMAGDLLYVGSSENVRTRVLEHVRNFKSGKGFEFVRATCLWIDWPWHLAIEALYIRNYKPPRNTYSRWRAYNAEGTDGHADDTMPT